MTLQYSLVSDHPNCYYIVSESYQMIIDSLGCHMYTVQTGYATADCEYININTYKSHNYCEQFTY